MYSRSRLFASHCLRVPDPYGAIRTSANDHRRFGAEGERMDGLRVARHRLDHSAVKQIPQLDGLVLSCNTVTTSSVDGAETPISTKLTSTGQISTIGTDGEAVDRFVMAHKDSYAFPTLNVPQPTSLVGGSGCKVQGIRMEFQALRPIVYVISVLSTNRTSTQ
jgi:hypothetical protein